jgi:hypothetical protein
MLLPAHISERIREVLAQGGGFPIDEEARSHGAIALMGTIGAIWMLRPDGTFWDADADFGKPLTPLSLELETTAIVAGTERFPWLKELLPARPPDAADCSLCGGRGVLVPKNAPPGSSGAFCPKCQALGWLSPETS